ncbi:MAG: TSUP family transporter, partial [Candidatus Zixiibacteriota bacterium]
IVGIVGGTYGIGGGAIISPFLVAVFRLPVYSVAGATLFSTFVSSIGGVLFYTAIAPFVAADLIVTPDWLLGFLFGIGGTAGVYLGARMQRFVPERIIKCILAAAVLFVVAKYVIDFVS